MPKALQDLRNHYIASGDNEKAALAEEELKAYHRMLKHPYNLKLEVPPETLHGIYNIPEANELFRQAIQYKEKSGSMGFVTRLHRQPAPRRASFPADPHQVSAE